MYRVLLKVDKVTLRIKESVEAYIQIRKGQTQFTHSGRQPLLNGQLLLTNTSEFFIHSRDPSFSIEIYLLLGATRKKGGVVEVDLNSFAINASHRVRSPIQQIPVQGCALFLDFVYMISSKVFEGQELYSLQDLENLNHRQYLQTISTQNQQLATDKLRLNGQIEELKRRNRHLQTETTQLTHSYQHRLKECEREILGMQAERNHSEGTLEIEKKRIAVIVDFINGSNNPDLIIQAEDIINRSYEQSKPH